MTIKTLYEDDVITSTKCEQLLSVKIDSKLNFDTHLNILMVGIQKQNKTFLYYSKI